MALPTVRPPRIRDTDDLSERETKTAVKGLDQPGVRKITVTGVQLGGTTVRVPHQLGRVPVGWQVTDKNAQADIWRDASIPSTGDTIPLKASATVTVTLQFW